MLMDPIEVALPPSLLAKDAATRLRALVEWLAPAAQRVGLTQYPTTEAFAAQLMLPALMLLQPPFEGYLTGPVLDFGAGSGGMGLALATVCPDLQIVLADRRSRVVQFADLCIARFGLGNCSSLQADLMAGPSSDLRYKLVLLRAFGPTEHALAAAQRWLAPGGAVALWHQPPAPSPGSGLTLALSQPTSVPSLVLTIYGAREA